MSYYGVGKRAEIEKVDNGFIVEYREPENFCQHGNFKKVVKNLAELLELLNEVMD